jgi:hypothetical protein
MAVQAVNVSDLFTFTLSQYRRDKFTDLMSGYQDTIAFKRIYTKKKMQNEDGDGTSITFNLVTDTNGSFRFVPLGFTAVLNANPAALQGSIPWRRWTYNWWADGAESAMNKGPAQIVDHIKVRMFQGVGSMIVGMERALWRVPAATDDLSVFGIPYYIVKSATAATEANADGFNGLVPSGYTTVAGINPSTYPRWANYSDAYTAVSKDDLIRKMRRMAEKTNYKPLVDNMPIDAGGTDRGMYMNYNTYGALVEAAESQNDDLGADIASMDGGRVLFRRASLDWTPGLGDDTTNPVYSCQWANMWAARMNGWWEKTIKVDINPQQPTVATTHVVTNTNLICNNRRLQGVISNGTTMPT